MNLLREIEKILAIRDSQKRLDAVIGPLEQLFERGRAWQFQPESLGKAASLLLRAAIEEQDAEMKEEMFSVLLTAVSWNEISKYIDWIALVEYLPHLSSYCLIYALGALGWSRKYAFLAVLQEYLAHPDIFVQVEALEAMNQIWWDTGKRNPALKGPMQIAALTDLQSMLLNPYQYNVAKKDLRERFTQICEKVIVDQKEWFRMNKRYEF